MRTPTCQRPGRWPLAIRTFAVHLVMERCIPALRNFAAALRGFAGASAAVPARHSKRTVTAERYQPDSVFFVFALKRAVMVGSFLMDEACDSPKESFPE